jgi:AcrR family transcriptional regulator
MVEQVVLKGMEKTKRTSRKRASGVLTEKITQGYQEHLLRHASRPQTIYKFCLDLGLEEEDFYTAVGSFDALESQVWTGYIRQTIRSLETDSSFQEFSAREKLLTFYFTLMEVLSSNRSFSIHLLGREGHLEIVPAYLQDFKRQYEEFAGSVIEEAIAKGEIAGQNQSANGYFHLLWVYMSLLLLYWRDDTSTAFEKTDAFIEKSVNQVFDLMSKGLGVATRDFFKLGV